ncbi:MAG TPA: FMN-binding glutamate synthase family protein [Firmicutes bacterium]|jgi:methylamine---glutamate N-methyltransferase subunit C|nr:FMN-binding glutamate synthase family protein [Bacillota bacterium]
MEIYKIAVMGTINMIILVIMIGIIVFLLTAIILMMIYFCYQRVRGEIAGLLLSPRFLEMLNLFSKLTWQVYFESQLRARTGKALERPFGTPLHFYSWNKILLQPCYLSNRPLEPGIPFDSSVILGPAARKPLRLNNPILIGGMSYGGALSVQAKIALAKASALFGTAANSGSGPFLKEEKAAADKFIFQYSRGFWGKSEAVLRQADMIEISLGHGAWSSAPVRIKGSKVIHRYARELPMIEGLDVLIESRLTEIENASDWRNFICQLKDVSGGIPIAVKIGATHHLEAELALIVDGGIDIVVIDGTEGGSHSVPPILSDDVGLPALPALCRASQFLKEQKLTGKISLIIGGGLYTPGDFLKCLALGADAVMIGTIAILAVSHTQVSKSTPWEPPTGLVYYQGEAARKFNPDLGAIHLYRYLQSCAREMEQAARTMGKRSFKEMNKIDLAATESLYAQIAGIAGISASGMKE